MSKTVEQYHQQKIFFNNAFICHNPEKLKQEEDQKIRIEHIKIDSKAEDMVQELLMNKATG